MDPEKITVHQLDDIVYEIVVQYYVKYQIFDNCTDRQHSHASFVLFRVAAETIEPKLRLKMTSKKKESMKIYKGNH